MAEIRVERIDRKKGIPVWAIVLALVVLAAIVAVVVSMRNHGHQQEVDHAALMAPAHVLVLETEPIYIPSARCA